MAQPSNAPYAVELHALMADEIWHYAEVDENSGTASYRADNTLDWYTKRAYVSAMYAGAELFMLQDTSENYQETWSFLERNLVDPADHSAVLAQVSLVVYSGVLLAMQKPPRSRRDAVALAITSRRS